MPILPGLYCRVRGPLAKRVEIVELFFRSGLQSLGKLVDDVAALMEPASPLAGSREVFGQRFPKPKRPSPVHS